MQIYIHRDNEDFGPYSQEAVVEYLKQGVFKETDYACYAGMSKWKTLKELLGNSTSSPGRGPRGAKSGGMRGSTQIPAGKGSGKGGEKKRTGMIVLNLFLVALVIIAAYIRFGSGGQKLRRMFMGMAPAAATPAETPPEESAMPAPVIVPKVVPIATPAPPKPFDISTLPARPDLWPKSVKLTQAVVFPAIFNGQTVGSVSVPAGSTVTLAKVENDQVDLIYNGAPQKAPWGATDIATEIKRTAATVVPSPTASVSSQASPAAAGTPAVRAAPMPQSTPVARPANTPAGT